MLHSLCDLKHVFYIYFIESSEIDFFTLLKAHSRDTSFSLWFVFLNTCVSKISSWAGLGWRGDSIDTPWNGTATNASFFISQIRSYEVFIADRDSLPGWPLRVRRSSPTHDSMFNVVQAWLQIIHSSSDRGKIGDHSAPTNQCPLIYSPVLPLKCLYAVLTLVLQDI